MIRRNWAHNTAVKSFRFDRVNSASATWGTNGTIEALSIMAFSLARVLRNDLLRVPVFRMLC